MGICDPYRVDNAYIMIDIEYPAQEGEDRSWAQRPIEEGRWASWLDDPQGPVA